MRLIFRWSVKSHFTLIPTIQYWIGLVGNRCIVLSWLFLDIEYRMRK